MTRRSWLIGTLALAALGGGCDRGTAIVDREVTVACGLCRLQIEGAHRCFWAAEIDGHKVPLTGPAVVVDADPHGPEGMCVVERKARIDGRLHGDKLVAESFELLPYDGPASEAAPHEH